MPGRPTLMALLALAMLAGGVLVCREGSPVRGARVSRPPRLDGSVLPSLVRSTPVRPATALTEERPGQLRTGVRLSGSKINTGLIASPLHRPAVLLEQLLSLLTRNLPRPRLHLLLCIWLT